RLLNQRRRPCCGRSAGASVRIGDGESVQPSGVLLNRLGFLADPVAQLRIGVVRTLLQTGKRLPVVPGGLLAVAAGLLVPGAALEPVVDGGVTGEEIARGLFSLESMGFLTSPPVTSLGA